MILRGKEVHSEQLLECEVDAGKIVRLEKAAASAPQGSLGGPEVYLSPGLVDIQVNGFGGVDLESDALTPDDVLRVLKAQWPYGVTQFLATITTGPTEQLWKGL